MEERLTLAILAGGISKRMGTDKALLPFRGQALIAHIAARGRGLTDDLLVATNHLEAYRFLNLPLHPDRLPLGGALAGMHAALSAAARPLVAVIACDMPFFSPDLLAHQAKLLAESGADAAIPLSQFRPEPLHGVYRREPCLAAVQQAVDQQIHSLTGWLGLLKLAPVAEEDWRRFDPLGRAFTNLNTMTEYRQWTAGED